MPYIGSRRALLNPPQAVAAPAASWVTAGLTGHWSMHAVDVTAGVLNDLVGSNDITLTNTAAATGPGAVANTALQFDGTAYGVFASKVFTQHFESGEYSGCFWAYVNSAAASDGAFFFNFFNSDDSNGFAPCITDGGGGMANVEIANYLGSGECQGSLQDIYGEDTWVHIGFTHQSNETTRIYINGVYDTNYALGTGQGTSPIATDQLGRRGAGSRLLQAGDRVGRALMYDGKVLSDAEMLQNYNAGG